MRIGFVDLIKLISAFIVCFYHFFNVVSPNPYYPLGDLTVELFVLIAGIFLFSGAEKQRTLPQGMQSPYAFLKKRFFRFFPYAIWGFLFALAVKIHITTVQGKAFDGEILGKWLSDGIWDVLMIKMNGMNDNQALLNVPAWTLSAMLIAEFLAYACLYNHKKSFETVIVPASIIIGLGIWRHIPDASHQLWLGFTTFGLLRVWILYCLSWYCYKLVVHFKSLSLSKAGRITVTVGEFVCYLTALLIIMNETSRNYRWIATLLLFLAVAVSISGKSVTARFIRNKKVITWMGEMSMGVYMAHYPVMQLFRNWYPGEQVLAHFLPFLIAVIVASVLFALLLRLSIGLCKRIHLWIRSRLIAEKTESIPAITEEGAATK